MTSRGTLERVRNWRERFAPSPPIIPCNGKMVVGGFGYKRQIATNEEALLYFNRLSCNAALVLGLAPHYFAVGDFETVKAYDQWRAGAGARVETLVERSRRGYHVFFKGEGLQLLSNCTDGTKEIEWKSHAWVLLAPARLRDTTYTDVVYTIEEPAPVATITPDRACQLFPFISPLPDFSLPAQRSFSSYAPPLGAGLVAELKANLNVVDELTAAGAKGWKQSQSSLVAFCPFHHDTVRSLWANPKTGLWGCFATGCRANTAPGGRKAYDVLHARALRTQGALDATALRQVVAELRQAVGR